jgi:RNA polymerase sigma factor (sigma-70 family)
METFKGAKKMITFNDYALNPSIVNRNKLVVANINLARFAAHRLVRKTSIPYDELEQIACSALIISVERFDPSRGSKFSTFAIPIINGRLLNFIRDNSHSIKLPRAYYETLQKGKKVMYRLSESLGRNPTSIEFFKTLGTVGVTKEDFEKAKNAYAACKYVGFYEDTFFIESNLESPAVETNDVPEDSLKDKISHILNMDIFDLAQDEIAVRMYFFEKASLNVIAKYLESPILDVVEMLRGWCQSA